MGCDRQGAEQDDVFLSRGEEIFRFQQQGGIGSACRRSLIALYGTHPGEGPVRVAAVAIYRVEIHGNKLKQNASQENIFEYAACFNDFYNPLLGHVSN